jgi:probable phosphoglycerate mutase
MLILVRHGRTRLNAEGRLQGRVDEPLDEIGHLQAAAIGRAIGTVDLVVTSPLLRARDTAAHLEGKAVEVDDRWIELDYGQYDGMPTRDVPREIWQKWRSDVDFVPAGGESIAGLSRRVFAALDDLAAAHDGRTIAVVSHVSPIKAAVSWTLGAPVELAWRTHLDQASVTRIGFGPAGAVLHTFNDTCHLA